MSSADVNYCRLGGGIVEIKGTLPVPGPFMLCPGTTTKPGFAAHSQRLLDLHLESAIPDRLILIHGKPDIGYRFLIQAGAE